MLSKSTPGETADRHMVDSIWIAGCLNMYNIFSVPFEAALVVYDEIHYLRDKERGVVWEESLILMPKSVRFAFLSATIPNAAEFAQWIAKTHRYSPIGLSKLTLKALGSSSLGMQGVGLLNLSIHLVCHASPMR